MSIPMWLAKHAVSQTYEQHLRNAGSTLGGIDWAGRIGTGETEMKRGTVMYAAGDGVFEWVTPSTKNPPAWYNNGLGYAAAVRYSNGCRTVFGHQSARIATPGSRVTKGDAISRSGGQKGSVGAGKSTGGHLHAHDVRADGTTRARPFSLIPGGGESAGGIEEGISTMFEFRSMRTQGNPALWAVTDGIEVRENITHPELVILRAGRDSGSVVREDNESEKDWEKRKAATLKFWKEEAARNRSLFGNGGTVVIDYARIAAAVNDDAAARLAKK